VEWRRVEKIRFDFLIVLGVWSTPGVEWMERSDVEGVAWRGVALSRVEATRFDQIRSDHGTLDLPLGDLAAISAAAATSPDRSSWSKLAE
jgi:hypothetical protein